MGRLLLHIIAYTTLIRCVLLVCLQQKGDGKVWAATHHFSAANLGFSDTEEGA